MKIYTITLNPAYDVHAFAQSIALYHENLAHVTSRQAGGKGVNISRTLAKNGIENTAVVVLGKDNSADFKEGLKEAGVRAILLEKPGRIRENLTIHCAHMPETRISFAGFAVDDGILKEVEDLLEVDGQTIITFTGRVASGMSMQKVKAFLRRLKEKGARIVLDSKSFSLEDIYEVSPWLIKPNQEEISQYLNCPVDSVEDAAEKAKLFAHHGVANVMVSLGEKGALLIAEGKTYTAIPPKVQAVSTIGAGDSSIGGFLAATYMGQNPGQCLKLAVAYGTAACLTEGTLPPEKADVERIYEKTEVKP